VANAAKLQVRFFREPLLPPPVQGEVAKTHHRLNGAWAGCKGFLFSGLQRTVSGNRARMICGGARCISGRKFFPLVGVMANQAGAMSPSPAGRQQGRRAGGDAPPGKLHGAGERRRRHACANQRQQHSQSRVTCQMVTPTELERRGQRAAGHQATGVAPTDLSPHGHPGRITRQAGLRAIGSQA
jgi:hypothetical protein